MTKPKAAPRARYTMEFKQEAVRLVEGGQSIAAVGRTLGVVDQTLFNWVKAKREGKLSGSYSRGIQHPLLHGGAGTQCPQDFGVDGCVHA